MLVLYTDGLIEFNRNLFDGEARLMSAAAESVRCNAEHPATFITEQVLGDAHPNDDVAVLTLSFESR
jgi:serine phosphatase RsbU (regulator of sigma subunit)